MTWYWDEPKNILLTGVIDGGSLATQALRILAASDQVRSIILASFPSSKTLNERIPALLMSLSAKERAKISFIGLDVTDRASMAELPGKVGKLLGEGQKLDGVLHSIARLHPRAMGEDDSFLDASEEDIEAGLEVSALSYRNLVRDLARGDMLNRNFSAVALSFHSQCPMGTYGVMGSIKGFLENIAKQLAKIYGPRLNGQVNVVSAAVYPSKAALAIPGFKELLAAFDHTPLQDETGLGLGRTLASFLLGLCPLITGSTIYADRGYDAMGGVGVGTRIVPISDQECDEEDQAA